MVLGPTLDTLYDLSYQFLKDERVVNTLNILHDLSQQKPDILTNIDLQNPELNALYHQLVDPLVEVRQSLLSYSCMPYRLCTVACRWLCCVL
jgi:hypothetical protein